MATSCSAVFHLASRVTGTLTRSSARIFAQARDQDLAAQDDDRGPERQPDDGTVGRQHQQAGRHQELVGDRVEHAAERRLLAPDAGEIAVENSR